MFHREALVLNFEIEIILAEDVAVAPGGGASGIVLPFHEALGYFAFEASGEANQSRGMLGEELLAHARLVVKAVQ